MESPRQPQLRDRRALDLHRAYGWADAVQRQAVRVHEAERAAYASTEAMRQRCCYGLDDSLPFSRMRADVHFLLTATGQLLTALERVGKRTRGPLFLHGDKVLRAVRNAVEHWDNDRAAAALQEHTDEPWDAHQWGAGGTLLAGVLSVHELEAWASQVQAHVHELITRS